MTPTRQTHWTGLLKGALAAPAGWVCAIGLLWAAPCAAFTLELPAASIPTTERTEALGTYALPIGPWQNGQIAVQPVEGAIRQSAYKVPVAAGQTTLQLLAPLRDQLIAAGFRVLFECAAQDCGGFDFRFETPVLPEPEMHVDLGDYRFLSADRGDEYISLLVSKSAQSGYVQVTRIGIAEAIPPTDSPAANPPAAIPPDPLAQPDQPLPDQPLSDQPQPNQPLPAPTVLPGSIAAALEANGSVALDDLAFPSGSADLAPGSYPSLTDLAAYLLANPSRIVVVVGHTDASGGLAANIALSRRRAGSVVNRLISLNVPQAQLSAQGVGFLSPRASNLTDTGRTQNRRVEVVLATTR